MGGWGRRPGTGRDAGFMFMWPFAGTPLCGCMDKLAMRMCNGWVAAAGPTEAPGGTSAIGGWPVGGGGACSCCCGWNCCCWLGIGLA